MRLAAATVVWWLVLASPGLAALPYHAQRGQVPNDLDDQEWKLAATPEAGSPYAHDPLELYGVRGAHVVDAADVDTAWQTTTGRTDVTIAVLDSGIKWNSESAMQDLRRKVRLNKGELP